VTKTAVLNGVQSAGGEKPLRVALFSGNYNYVVDGPVKALNTLVGHLLKRGHEVLVFAPTIANPPFKAVGELVSVPSFALPGSRSEYRIGLGLYGERKRRLDAFKPDLIHIAAPDLTGLAALKYAEARCVAPVASFHTRFDTYPRYYGAAWAEKYVTGYMRNFYARCRHVYAPSLSMVDELRRDRIGKDIRLWARGVDKALYNPSRRDLPWRRAQGFSDDDVVIVFVGRVVLEKGIDVFADAVQAASARNPRIKALIVGEGPERARFTTMLPKAVFTGYQGGADLARCYASADVFFNPSITETFGNVTLEAMASALPSVCAAASGSRSLVEDGVNGLLSPPEAGAAGYADKLCALAADAALRRRMAAAALARAQDFDWETLLDRLILDYREAIASSALARRAPAD
jgi:glycosyltransferase involved in cell wall biosynthesis